MNSERTPNTARVAALVLTACFAMAGCHTAQEPAKPASGPSRSSLEDQWGIRIASLRVTAAGQMIDFRYRILDPEKAVPIVDRKLKPQLIDQASHRALGVPVAPKVGALRQTSVKPIAGRIYFVLFGNPNQLVKPGSKVTVVIGNFRVENLIVE